MLSFLFIYAIFIKISVLPVSLFEEDLRRYLFLLRSSLSFLLILHLVCVYFRLCVYVYEEKKEEEEKDDKPVL